MDRKHAYRLDLEPARIRQLAEYLGLTETHLRNGVLRAGRVTPRLSMSISIAIWMFRAEGVDPVETLAALADDPSVVKALRSAIDQAAHEREVLLG